MAAMARRVRRPPLVLVVTVGALVAGSCSSSKLGLIRSSAATDAAMDRGTTVDGTTVDGTTVDAALEVRRSSDAAGACAGLPFGTPAPAGACPDMTPASCGLDGTCDGAGGCHRYPAETVCAAPTCVDSVTARPASVCDGQGTCVAGTPLTCSPTTCVNGACYADDCRFFPLDCVTTPNRDASPG